MMSQFTEDYEDMDLEMMEGFDVEDDDDGDEEEFFEGFDGDEYEDEGDFEDFGSEGFVNDDGDDGESLAERRFRRRRMPVFRRRRFRRRFRRPRPMRSVRSVRRAVLRTPAGNAQIRLPTPVATQSSVNARMKEIKLEIGRNTSAIKKVDSTLEKNTAIVDKKINRVSSDLRKSNKKMEQRLQQSALMPLLLQSKPKLETVTIQALDANGNVADGTAPTKHKVTAQEFDSDNNNLLPLIMLMGGMGDGGDSNNMLMMALVLSGGFGNKKK